MPRLCERGDGLTGDVYLVGEQETAKLGAGADRWAARVPRKCGGAYWFYMFLSLPIHDKHWLIHGCLLLGLAVVLIRDLMCRVLRKSG